VQAGKTVLLRWQGVTLSSDMVLIDGGKFLMSDPDRGVRIKPTHQVKLDRFFIGKYPVTFAEYDTYCEDSGQKKPSDNSWGRDSRPVIIISWWDAIKYCNWRSNQEGWSVAYNSQGLLLDANGAVTSDITQVQGYRLPTEAEWEYAARGGQKSQGYGYSGSNSLEEVGWYTSNSGITTQPVGEKKGNELGLYDMSGNVWEWCYDLLAVSEERNIINPIGAVNGDCRAFRGGSYTTLRSSCRVAQRGLCPPENSHSDLGFRLVRSAPVASNEAIDTPGSASDFVLHPNLVSPELPFIGYGLTDDEQNLFLVLSDGRGILISLATERIIARFPHLEADDLRQCPHMKMFPDALVILRGNEVSGTVGWEKYIAFIRGSDFCEDEALYQMHYRPLREMLNATN
jgi:formylglycine-generating enzyme required for sulfatase activity